MANTSRDPVTFTYFTILTRPSTPSVIYRIVLTFERQNMTKTSSKSSVGETIIKIHLNK